MAYPYASACIHEYELAQRSGTQFVYIIQEMQRQVAAQLSQRIVQEIEFKIRKNPRIHNALELYAYYRGNTPGILEGSAKKYAAVPDLKPTEVGNEKRFCRNRGSVGTDPYRPVKKEHCGSFYERLKQEIDRDWLHLN